MKPVVAFGEVLLRLKSPGVERLLQSPSCEASFGGAELNVLASLSRFGELTECVTALPTSVLGRAALEAIRGHGVGTRHVLQRPGRMGLYFLEAGSGARTARVLYDRAGSVFARCGPQDYDWQAILDGCRWLHLTGITPPLGEGAERASVEAARTAVRLGIPVSFDVNFRSQLWLAAAREPRAVLEPVLECARVVFAAASDWGACLPGQARSAGDAASRFDELSRAMLERYPRVETIACSLRTSSSAEDCTLIAFARTRECPVESSRTIAVRAAAERIGSGDAFVAGCLHGLLAGRPVREWLEFALAAQALKHTIPGDVNRASAEEVAELLDAGDPGRVLR